MKIVNIRDPMMIKEVGKSYIEGVTYKELEKIYEIPQSTIKSWRKKYNWQREKQIKNKGPRGAPKGNKNRLNHGLYAKNIPKEIQDIIEATKEESPIAMLWSNILIHNARIIHSQKIMHVKNKNDMTKELKKEKLMDGDKYSTEEKEYEIQFAWDKQANFLRVQSAAMATLNRMLKEYDEMVHKNWELATEEQKARIDKLRQGIDGTEEGMQQQVIIIDNMEDDDDEEY